jgi:hypothetical protein
MQFNAAAGNRWCSEGVTLIPNRLRDPQGGLIENQPFPENFLYMAAHYQSYRVYGMRMMAEIHGINNSENRRTIAIAYGITSLQAFADPYPISFFNTSIGPPFVRGDMRRNQVLQNESVRRKVIVDAGNTGAIGANVWQVGWWNMSGMEEIPFKDMDDATYSGSVNPDGSVVSDPVNQPAIFFKLLANGNLEYVADDTLGVTFYLDFNVEWFDRRDKTENVRDEGEVAP